MRRGWGQDHCLAVHHAVALVRGVAAEHLGQRQPGLRGAGSAGAAARRASARSARGAASASMPRMVAKAGLAKRTWPSGVERHQPVRAHREQRGQLLVAVGQRRLLALQAGEAVGDQLALPMQLRGGVVQRQHQLAGFACAAVFGQVQAVGVLQVGGELARPVQRLHWAVQQRAQQHEQAAQQRQRAGRERGAPHAAGRSRAAPRCCSPPAPSPPASRPAPGARPPAARGWCVRCAARPAPAAPAGCARGP